MCTLLSSTDFARYSPRTYTYCPGDEHSLRLVRELERSKAGGDSSEVRLLFSSPPWSGKREDSYAFLALCWHRCIRLGTFEETGTPHDGAHPLPCWHHPMHADSMPILNRLTAAWLVRGSRYSRLGIV